MVGNSAFKSKNKQNELLQTSNNPKALCYNSPFYTDWVVEEEKKYPYQLDDILIQPNELVTAYVLNATFEKLYANIEYLVSRCIFYSNDIPSNYVGWFGCALNMVDGFVDKNGNSIGDTQSVTYQVDKEYQFHNNTKYCYQYYPCKYAGLANIIDDNTIFNYTINESLPNTNNVSIVTSIADPNYNSNDKANTYSNPNVSIYDNLIDVVNFTTKTKQVSLMITTNGILMKHFTQSDENNITINDLYENESILSSINGYKFENINSASLDTNGYLYISDANTKNIYQFDLNYIINDDSVIRTPRLLNIIGGHDGVEKQYKFSNVKFIKSSGGNIFVYDDVEHNIVVFDEFLNFKKIISNIGFTFNTPVGIVYRDLQDEFIILCENAKYFVFDSQFNFKFSYQLTDVMEKCTAFASSTIDSNVYYIATTTSVIQKLFSNNVTVGYFRFADLGIKNDTLKWWRTTHITWKNCKDLWSGSYNFPTFMNTFNVINLSVRNVGNSDEIWIFANNGRLVWLRNDIKLLSLFDDQISKYIYPLNYKKENLKCNEQEYVQSFTYNKMSRKFVDILYTLIQNLKYKPIYEYNSSGEKIFLHLQDNSHEISNIINENHLKNIKIYDNDILSVDVINRVIKNLYDIEQQLLNATKADILNSKYQKTQNMEIEIGE